MIVTENITISNIYWNKGLSGYFFREQSMKTLEDLINNASMSGEEVLRILDEQTEDVDLDEVEEMFYDMSLIDIADELGIELESEENDDE